jgi:hypothetical protein
MAFLFLGSATIMILVHMGRYLAITVQSLPRNTDLTEQMSIKDSIGP